MYVTRDWMTFHGRSVRLGDVAHVSDRIPEAVHEALAEVDTAERAKRPDVFRKVDRILSRINRKPQYDRPFAPTRTIVECPRCGDDFPQFRRRDIYCSMACSSQHRAWLKRRQVAATGHQNAQPHRPNGRPVAAS